MRLKRLQYLSAAIAPGPVGLTEDEVRSVPWGEPVWAEDGDVRVCATVGLSLVTWAADRDDGAIAWSPGTINVVAILPARLTEAALVNAVITATEAKTQALFEHGVPGTGTASDAVCIVCPPTGDAEPFGGPRSAIGAALARAVHDAVSRGIPAAAR